MFGSIGMPELIIIFVIALIIFGPRKLPELAKKAGKIMSEFRGTANEFKQTWEKEVNFEEEAKSLSLSSLDEEPVARADSMATPAVPDAPSIKAADPEAFKHLIPAASDAEENSGPAETTQKNDKKNWL